jgi:hypothetical protein
VTYNILIIHYLLRYLRYERKEVSSIGMSYFTADHARHRKTSDTHQVS